MKKDTPKKSIGYIRRRVFSKRDSFSSLDKARRYLREELEKLNLKPKGFSR
jgi:hypothetical protein